MTSNKLFWLLTFFLFGGLIATGFMFNNGNKLSLFVIEGFAVIAVLFTVVLYRRLIKPYKVLISGMDLLNGQDFSTRLHRVGNNEADKIIEIFNLMLHRLREERLSVRETNQFLDLLVKASPQGIIILNFNDRITGINPAGLSLLHLDSAGSVMGKHLNELQGELVSRLATLRPGDDMVVRNAAMSMYRCIRSSFVDKGFNHPFILIEDLTHELLKVEKQSYENIIRIMSHEVNNSTGAIGATLNVISDAMRHTQNNEWDDVLPVVDTSSERCRHLSDFVAGLADVVRIPKPLFSDVPVNSLVGSAVNLVASECNRRNIRLQYELAAGDDKIRADRIQIEQVLVNIIKNACESIGENGAISIIADAGTIIVEDNGPGISEVVKQNLFSSFFTTKSTGHGLGLMFVKEVLLNHHFGFDLYTENGITRFKIKMA